MQNQKYFSILLLAIILNFSLLAQDADTALASQYLEKGAMLNDSAQFSAALILIDKAVTIYANTPIKNKKEFATTAGNQSLEYAKALYHKANILRVQDQGKLAQSLGNQALTIQRARLDSTQIDLGFTYIMLSKMLTAGAHYDSAQVFIDKAKYIAQVNEDKFYRREVLKAEAFYYNTIDPKKNIALLDSALQYTQIHFPNDQIIIGEFYYRLGATYNDFDIAKSNAYLNKSLTIFNHIPNLYYWQANATFMLGVNSINAKKLEKSQQQFLAALELYQKVFPAAHFMNIQCSMNLALVASYKGNPKKAIQYYKEIETVLNKSTNPNITHYGTVYQNIGALYSDLGDYFNAEVYNKKAIEYVLKDKAANEDLALSYLNLAVVYSSLDLDNQTEQYLQKAADVLADCTTLGCQRLKRYLLFNIGSMNFNQGDTEKSLAYTIQAITIDQQLGDSLNIINDYINIALSYGVTNQNDLAIAYLEKGLTILEKHIPNNYLVRIALYEAFSQAYHRKEKYAQAKNYIRSAIALQEKEASTNKGKLSILYSNLASTYLATKQFKLARKYANKSLNLNLALYGNQSPKLSMSNIDLAFIDIEQKNWEAANAKLSLVAKLLQVAEKSWLLDIREESYIKYFSTQTILFNTLFEVTKDAKYLDSVILTINNALLYEKAIIGQFKTDAAKRQFFQHSYEFYLDGIAAYFQQATINTSRATQTLTQLYELSEKSLLKTVRFNFNSIKAANFANYPITLQQKETALTNEITWLEKKVELLPLQEGISEDSIRLLQAELATAQLSYFSFLDTIKQQYPEYHQLKYSNDVSSLHTVQKTLGANETMLKYIVADANIYIIGINSDEFTVKSVKHDSLFKYHLQNLIHHSRSLIADKATEKQMKNNISESGHYLYQQLMLPMESMLKEKLVIIPSQQLYQLSFDLLLQDKPSLEVGYNDWSFLIKNHAISYAFSATLYHQQSIRNPSKATLPFYAVAPFFGDATLIDTTSAHQRSLGALLYNQTEAITIARLFQNSVLALSENASLLDFLKNAATAKIIHLSTHALTDDQRGEYCQIVFAESDTIQYNRLYAKDLYGLKLDADLVVLSACETALGEQQNGEGLIGLNQGFAYAGARSIVTSLWQIDDKSTKELMVFFYKNLQKGLPKDEALRQAKLSMLAAYNAQPYLWAAFVPFGNMEAIAIAKPWNWMYLSLAGVFICLLGFIFYVKRIKNR